MYLLQVPNLPHYCYYYCSRKVPTFNYWYSSKLYLDKFQTYFHSQFTPLHPETQYKKSSYFCRLRKKKMVSPKLALTIVKALVLFFFIYESEGASYSSGSHIDGAEITPFAYQKVNLSVYYQSLCQPCATFIIKNLGEIFNSDIINIVNLQLVPWAYAYINTTNSSILCQNGPDECELNSLEACALNIWPDVNIHYALIYCFEFMVIEGWNKKWDDCFNQLDLPEEPIQNCLNRGNGTELGKKIINETAQLYPPPSFVPWVVVNDEPIGKDYANFTYYVCKAYRGVAAPAVCNLH